MPYAEDGRPLVLLSASRFGAAAGHSPYEDDTPERVALERLLGRPPEDQIPTYQYIAMQRGTLSEAETRRWYEKTTKTTVTAGVFCIPEWEPRIGGAPDGYVGDNGLLEIKSPVSMYPCVRAYVESKTSEPPTAADIPVCHYDQIQGCLAITERQWCDYIVAPRHDDPHSNDPLDSIAGQRLMIRIPFNPSYWGNLLVDIRRFLDMVLNDVVSTRFSDSSRDIDTNA